MAIFKGIPTQVVPTTRPNGILAEKWVRANPDFVRYSGVDLPEHARWNYMNSWEIEQDPSNPKFRAYRCYVYFAPGWSNAGPWRVVISLGINDAMHRMFPTQEAALAALEAIRPMTTKRTLYNRGFRTW